MRTRAALRTFPTHCNTCTHFCKLSTQNVPFICSALQAPCMRCALPAALSTRLAQTVHFSALESSTGISFGNISVACNAHMIATLPPQLVACAGHGGAFRRRNIILPPPMLQRIPRQLPREGEKQQQHGQKRSASQRQSSNGTSYPSLTNAHRTRMPASRGCRLTPMPAPCGCSP